MNKVKWGVIGAGGIADKRTIPGMILAKDVELVAVMDVNKEVAEKIQSKYNVSKAYDNVETLLADSNVEAVYIASPVVFHKEQAINAARADKHILVEKPIALTCIEGEEVIKVSKENNILAAAGFMMRFHAYHQKMREIIEEGKLGQIVSCRAQFAGWYPDIPGAWRQMRRQSGGGVMMDLAVHCIDLIQYVTGSKAIKVAGLAGTKTFNYEVDDSASVLFETDNAAYCYVDVNFNIPNIATKCRFEVYGTKGSLSAEDTISQEEGGKLELVLIDDKLAYNTQQDKVYVTPMDIQVEFGNMYTKEIESFSNSILNNTPIAIPLEDALQVQKVIEAAYDSACNHRYVFV